MRFQRLFWPRIGVPAIPFALMLLAADAAHWKHPGNLEGILTLETMLAIFAVSLPFFVRRATTRATMEYVRSLPLTRERAVFAPYAVAGAWMAIMGLFAHLLASTGAGYFTNRVILALLAPDEAAGLVYRRSLAHVQLSFLAYPLLAFWATTFLIETWRRRAARAYSRHGWVEIVAAIIVGGNLVALGEIALMPWGGTDRLEPARRALLQLPYVLACLALAGVLARKVRGRVAGAGLEVYPVEV